MHWEQELNTSLPQYQILGSQRSKDYFCLVESGECWDGTDVVYLVLKRKGGGKGGKGIPLSQRNMCKYIEIGSVWSNGKGVD